MSLPSPAEIASALIAREEMPPEKGDIGPQGKAGEFGPPGPQGAKGDPGRNGTNGSNGNVGPKGPIGPGGPRGPKGEKGDKGDEGERGPIGPMGPTGAVGSGKALFPRPGGGSSGGAPSGAAGGDLSGTYPNPSVVDDSHSHGAGTAPGGGGLPDWWTLDNTPDAESVEFDGRVIVDPPDQTDAAGEGLLWIKTNQDLVDQSNLGAIVASTIAGSDGTDLPADYIFMLTVLGLYINTPVEEGGATIEVKARGVPGKTQLTNDGLLIFDALDAIQAQISVESFGLFGVTPAGQQTAATLGGIYAALEAYGLLNAASAQPTVQTYTESNVTTDRAFNANATSIDELADVLGTLIVDLRAQGVVA